MRCDFHDAHDPVTDKPTGNRCTKDATHKMTWEDGRFSFGCDAHLDIEPQATVKPIATEKLVVIHGWTQEDLDKATCDKVGCTEKHHHGPLYLHARCHAKSAVITKYHWLGYLELRCKTCNKLVVNVFASPEDQVARGKQMIDLCPHGEACEEPPDHHAAILRGCEDHRGAGVHVAYWKGDLTIACARCRDAIDTIHVKHGEEQA